ncbi:MAG: hypothetical protein WCK89_25710 [bacterium]
MRVHQAEGKFRKNKIEVVQDDPTDGLDVSRIGVENVICIAIKVIAARPESAIKFTFSDINKQRLIAFV